MHKNIKMQIIYYKKNNEYWGFAKNNGTMIKYYILTKYKYPNNEKIYVFKDSFVVGGHYGFEEKNKLEITYVKNFDKEGKCKSIIY